MKKENRAFKFGLVILILLFIWIFLAYGLAWFLIVEKPLEKADAIFVLAGSAAYVERNQKAAELYKQGVAPKIFLTNDGMRGGWNEKEQRNPYYIERARWELTAQGVPDNAIEILPGTVAGTDEEAALFAKIVAEKNLKSVLLVTSAYHTRRTLRTFEKAASKNDLSVELGVESPPPGEQTPKPFVWWLSRRGWRDVAGEYVKILYYWVYY